MNIVIKVFSADIIAKIITTFTTIILIRYMSDYDYATYTVFVAIANIYNQIAISSFGKMYIVDYKFFYEKEYTLLLMEVALSVLVGYIFLFIQPVTKSNYLLLFFLMVSTCIFGYVRVIYQQQCKFKLYTIVEMLRVLSFFVLIVGCYEIINVDLMATHVLSFQIVSLLIPVVFINEAWSKINIVKKLEFKSIFRYLLQKEQWCLLIYSSLMAVLLQIDVLALKTWGTNYNVSTYASAFKYYGMMLLLLNTVNSVLLPKISSEDNYIKINKMYKQQDILSVFLLVGIIAAIVIAPYVLPIIDGGKYPEAIDVFRILCVSAFISFWGSPYNNILIKEKKFLGLCVRFIFSIMVAVVGNYFMIPMFDVDGTAIITLVSYGIVNLSSRVQAKKIIKEKVKEAMPNAN